MNHDPSNSAHTDEPKVGKMPAKPKARPVVPANFVPDGTDLQQCMTVWERNLAEAERIGVRECRQIIILTIRRTANKKNDPTIDPFVYPHGWQVTRDIYNDAQIMLKGMEALEVGLSHEQGCQMVQDIIRQDLEDVVETVALVMRVGEARVKGLLEAERMSNAIPAKFGPVGTCPRFDETTNMYMTLKAATTMKGKPVLTKNIPKVKNDSENKGFSKIKDNGQVKGLSQPN